MKSKAWITALLVIPCALLLVFSTTKKTISPEFLPSEPCAAEKSFVFLIYSDDLPKTLEQNIVSILEQTYENYRIIVMETGNMRPFTQMVKTTIAKQNKLHLLTTIAFEEESPNVECFENALSFIKEDEIVIQIESNDWLAHNLVLTKLNQIYSNSDDTWLLYSQYLEYPSYQKGSVDPYLKKNLRTRYARKSPWLSSHLKVYYAGLLKTLKSDPNTKLADDLDLYFQPLAEYSKNHIRYIEDVLYVHNTKQ